MTRKPQSDVPRGILRAIDANLNRAREAARVIEDVARFAEGAGATQGLMKAVRHDLALAERTIGTKLLLAHRDTELDSGTGITGWGEMEREDAGDLATANFHRLSEALRCIEEFTKTGWQDISALMKQLRYGVYSTEQFYYSLSGPRGALLRGGVMLLVTRSMCRRPPDEVVAGAAEAGIRCFQLREKEGTDRQRARQLAASVEGVCETRRIRGIQRNPEENPLCIIINDRADFVRAFDPLGDNLRLVNLAGVHVGPDDLPPRAVREILGSRAIIGASVRTPAHVADALRQRADYLGAGAMFPSETKPGAKVAGPKWALRAEKLAKGLPVFAIGGITLENAHVLKQAGIRRIAVCSAICGAKDPKAAAKALVKLFPDLNEGEHDPTRANGNRYRPSVIQSRKPRSRAT
jgi:thiamine-phosphate pyrophosphorylase